MKSISLEVEFERQFSKGKLRNNWSSRFMGEEQSFPVKESSKIRLMNRSHVISLEVETCISMEVEKVFD